MADDVKKPEEFTWPLAAVVVALLVTVAGFVLGMNYLQVLAAGCR